MRVAEVPDEESTVPNMTSFNCHTQFIQGNRNESQPKNYEKNYK